MSEEILMKIKELLDNEHEKYMFCLMVENEDNSYSSTEYWKELNWAERFGCLKLWEQDLLIQMQEEENFEKVM